MSKITRADRLAFFGTTGGGKSELARALWVGFAPPRIVVDVKDDLGDRLPGVPTVRDPGAVVDFPTVRAVPDDPSDPAWYDALYRAAFDQGETVVWLDEANEVTKPNYVPRQIRRFVLQGRSRGCGHLACTPRPADVHPVFASQAGHVFLFRMRHPRDRKAVAELAGLPPAEVDDTLDDLPDFGFAYLETATGEMTTFGPSHDPEQLTRQIAARYFGPERDDPARLLGPGDALTIHPGSTLPRV